MNFKKFIIIFIVVFGLISFVFLTFPKKTKTNEVVLAGKTFFVEIADTPALSEKGLSGHKPLLNNQGMLFEFKKSDRYGFWMKDMNFSLDILWIDENYKIVHIEKNLTPDTYPKVYYPEVPSRYVLEISAMQTDLLKVKIGDVVKFAEK